MLNITEVDSGFQVRFDYKPWIVSAIKQFNGAQFRKQGDDKFWLVPKEAEQPLLNWAKPFIGDAVIKKNVIEIGEIESLPDLTIEIPLLRKLFPYQSTGVAYALQKKKVIVGDQPGLGKTGQAIATMVGAGAKCVLVICPATIRENWKRE